MLNNIRGILNRRSDQNRSPESLLSGLSDDSSENNVDSAEGFLCPSCFIAFPTGEALQNHYEIAHNENLNGAAADGKNKYVCSACKMKLGSEIELQSHYKRHHSENKKENEMKATELQMKAWEDIRLYLETELKAKSEEVTKLREERDRFEQTAAKLAKELADLKVNLDELESTKIYLQNSLKVSEEKISKLEVEIQQRPEQDDVIELQKGIQSVQKEMEKLHVQKEAEKDKLEMQYNVLQETCTSFRDQVAEMALTINNLKEDLKNKEIEKEKLKQMVEKFGNYNQIKASLIEKQKSYEELLKQSNEKDSVVSKLKCELNKIKENVEEIQEEKKRLYSEIANGKGSTEAMLQLREENDRLRQQFITEQTRHLQLADESESKLNEMRLILEKTKAELLEKVEKCSELESELKEIKSEMNEIKAEKNNLSTDLKLQISNLSSAEEAYKQLVQNLDEELTKYKKLNDEKDSCLAEYDKELELLRTSQAELVEKFQATKKEQDAYIMELAENCNKTQKDLTKKEQALADLEKVFKELSDNLKEEKKQKSELEIKCNLYQRNCEEAKGKVKELESIMEEREAAKIEFCNKISSLNEELMNLAEVNSQFEKKCASLEYEVQSLKPSVTKLQNEKNSLLNELEIIQKTVAELEELKTSHLTSIEQLTDSYQKEKAHSEKTMKEFNLAKEIYLNDKLKMQKQLENLESDCVKQLSLIEEKVKSLTNQLEESERKCAVLNSTLDDTKKSLRQKEVEVEAIQSRHTAQVGVLSENIQTLREDLSSEQKRRETLEQELEEVRGSKLELEAKLENALEERSGLLKRCIKSEGECERLQKSVSEMRHKYEDCVAALQELGRENQTLQVENMKHITRKWADDSEVTHCTACGKLFTVTVRKHHCRNCGSIFCNECSAKTATVAASKKPVRVCDICYVEVTK